MSTKLTIITANIGYKNLFGKRAVVRLHNRKPEVLCLQEVLQSRTEHLKELGYQTGKAEDYRHIGNKSGYVITGMKTKNAVISLERVQYADKRIVSLWGWLIYTKIAKLREKYEAVMSTFRYQGKIYRVVNAHLSIACRPQVRVAQLATLLKRYADGRTIFCGDFNIVSDALFRLMIGWACGYHIEDYFYNERAEVNKLIVQYKLQSPFAKRKTTRYPFHQQFDHILVPECFEIKRKKMIKISLSDHKALYG